MASGVCSASEELYTRFDLESSQNIVPRLLLTLPTYPVSVRGSLRNLKRTPWSANVRDKCVDSQSPLNSFMGITLNGFETIESTKSPLSLVCLSNHASCLCSVWTYGFNSKRENCNLYSPSFRHDMSPKTKKPPSGCVISSDSSHFMIALISFEMALGLSPLLLTSFNR